MAQFLSDLNINEVSLVDRPANSEIDPITGKKTARAIIALYKRDSSTEDFVKGVEGRISKGVSTMTLEQIEKKLTDQETVLKAIQTENEVLKAENETVLKMSKKDRKAYASMSDDQRKAFMAGDDDKKKNMMISHQKEAKEKAAADSMDDATCAKFLAAGPVEKAAILERFEKAEKIKKAKAKVKKGKGDSEGGKPAEGSDAEEAEESPEEEAAEEDSLKKELTLKHELARTVDRITKTERELFVIQKQQRLEGFAKRAETELPHTAGTPIEKGEMLMTMADTMPGGEGGEAFTKVLNSLKAADKALSAHFSEVGKHGGGNMPALAVFDAKVEEISKRDKVSKSKATETAMMEAPDLYLQYEHDQRQFALNR